MQILGATIYDRNKQASNIWLHQGSNLQDIPSYGMSIFLPPKTLTGVVEKIMNAF